MGQVVATIKLYPEDIVIGVNQIKQEIEAVIPANVKVHKFIEEPIAFGLIALIAHIIIPEQEGILEEIENILKEVNGVGQIEVMLVRRV